MNTESMARAIRAEALRLGFERVGFCGATPPPEASRFDQWLAAGMHAGMKWLETGRDKRLDPGLVLEGARSLVVVAHAYASPGTPPDTEVAPGEEPRGFVARYARGDDYHEVTGARLTRLQSFIETSAPGHRALSYVDTGPLLERMWAARAGIGWVGKNALVMNDEMGSYFFIGVILTTLELPPDEPIADRCGSCSLCIDACPTAAIVEPRMVDSRKCISYHTIELRGALPVEDRAAIGTRVFGCDDCQEVCPWNGAPGEEGHGSFPSRSASVSPSLVRLLTLGHTDYLERFRGSAVKRATYKGLRRNAAVALGNALAGVAPGAPGSEPAKAALLTVAGDKEEDPSLREHARWGAERAGSGGSGRGA